MAELFTNNARSRLSGSISDTDTSLTILSGDGNALFPALGGSDFFRCVLFSNTGDFEFIIVGGRSGDTFSSITRSSEAIGNLTPTPFSFPAGSLIELRPTKAFFDSLSSVTSSAVQSMDYNYAVDTGAANAHVVALNPAPAAQVAPLPIVMLASDNNTGISTLNAGFGATPIKLPDGGDLIAGDIVNAKPSFFLFGGGVYTLMNPRASYSTGIAKLTTVNAFTEMQQLSAGADIVIAATDETIGLDGNHFKLSAAAAQDLHSLQNSIQAGASFSFEFTDANITLKHAATPLAGFEAFDLPGGVDRTMAIGDIARFTSRGSGNNYIVRYDRADGLASIILPLSVRDISRNLVITAGTVPTSEITITGDELILQDTSGNAVRRTGINHVDVDITAPAGVSSDGLDVGTWAADTLYYIWVTWNGSNEIILSSLESDISLLSKSLFDWTHASLIGSAYSNSSNEISSTVKKHSNVEIYTSAPYTTYAAGTTLTAAAHSLSGVPDQVWAMAKCIQADLNYAVGDWVSVSDHHNNNNYVGLSWGLQLYATSSTVGGVIGSQAPFGIPDKSSGGTGTPTAGRWEIYIKAVRYT